MKREMKKMSNETITINIRGLSMATIYKIDELAMSKGVSREDFLKTYLNNFFNENIEVGYVSRLTFFKIYSQDPKIDITVI